MNSKLQIELFLCYPVSETCVRNEDENRLARLAVETGGRVIKVEGFEKMQSAFDQISEELYQQYSLGYRPSYQNWNGDFRREKLARKRMKQKNGGKGV